MFQRLTKCKCNLQIQQNIMVTSSKWLATFLRLQGVAHIETNKDVLFFSSAEEPGGVKAYFILRFRAVGKFLRKLIDQLGQGNVPAAGKLL